MKLQILGASCAKCKQLAQNAEAAAQQLGLKHEIEKITEISGIVAFGVMRTPALAIDGVPPQSVMNGTAASPTTSVT